MVRQAPMRQNRKQFLLIKVADETQIAAHGIERHVAFALDRSITITQLPKQGLYDVLVRNALVI